MRAASSGLPSRSAARMAEEEISPVAIGDQRGFRDAEAEAGAFRAERVDIAGAFGAEAEIGADGHMGEPEPVAQHALAERGRRERRERGVEGQDIEALHARSSPADAPCVSGVISSKGGASGAGRTGADAARR
jgi:hypothetical protein